jgi:hypothetical protein
MIVLCISLIDYIISKKIFHEQYNYILLRFGLDHETLLAKARNYQYFGVQPSLISHDPYPFGTIALNKLPGWSCLSKSLLLSGTKQKA